MYGNTDTAAQLRRAEAVAWAEGFAEGQADAYAAVRDFLQLQDPQLEDTPTEALRAEFVGAREDGGWEDHTEPSDPEPEAYPGVVAMGVDPAMPEAVIAILLVDPGL